MAAIRLQEERMDKSASKLRFFCFDFFDGSILFLGDVSRIRTRQLLDQIEICSAERPVQLEVVQFKALLY